MPTIYHQSRFLMVGTLPPSLFELRRTSRFAHLRTATCGLHEQARQLSFMGLSPTIRKSILLIRSERSASAALMASVVCRNVLTFDPSDTMPPSTAAIEPRASLTGAEQAEHHDEQQCDAAGDRRLGNHNDLSASLRDFGKRLEPLLDE